MSYVQVPIGIGRAVMKGERILHTKQANNDDGT
jgi:hypothetical protein